MAKRVADHKAGYSVGGCRLKPMSLDGYPPSLPGKYLMTGLHFVVVITAALIAIGSRRWRRARLRRASRARAGASPESAILIRSYGEMEDHLMGRWCHCGGFLERRGEGTQELGSRRYRVASLCCQECEELHWVFFDTTDVPH